MGGKRSRQGKLLYLYLASIAIAFLILGGCTTLKGMFPGEQGLREANQLAARGDEAAALKKYEQVLNGFPEMGDQALFRMGILYAQSKETAGNYQKALDCLQAMLKKYPRSRFTEEAGVLVALINGLMEKEQKARTLQRQAEAWEKKAEALEKKIEQMKEIDLGIELKKRRLQPLK